MRARHYDPITERFTQQDAAEDGYNWYIYGNNNPVIYADENGESIIIAGVAISNEVAALIGTGTVILGYLASKAFVDAFVSSIKQKKSIIDSIKFAKGKAKKPNPPSKLKNGDKVKTPDTHPEEFTKDKGSSSYTHKKTKWKFKKDTLHNDGHWDVSPTGNHDDYICKS